MHVTQIRAEWKSMGGAFVQQLKLDHEEISRRLFRSTNWCRTCQVKTVASIKNNSQLLKQKQKQLFSFSIRRWLKKRTKAPNCAWNESKSYWTWIAQALSPRTRPRRRTTYECAVCAAIASTQPGRRRVASCEPVLEQSWTCRSFSTVRPMEFSIFSNKSGK